MEDLYRSALALAIARFIHDGHPLADAAREWITPGLERLRDQPLEDIKEEAVLREEILERWRKWVQAEQPRVGWLSDACLARGVRPCVRSHRLIRDVFRWAARLPRRGRRAHAALGRILAILQRCRIAPDRDVVIERADNGFGTWAPDPAWSHCRRW